MAKSAQDSWIIKASTFFFFFLSFEKRAAFWKAALHYEYSDAAHTAGKNKVDAHSLRRGATLGEREKLGPVVICTVGFGTCSDLHGGFWSWILVTRRRRSCWNQKQTTFLLPRQGIFIYNLPIHFHLTNKVWFGNFYQLWNDKETKELQGTFQCPMLRMSVFIYSGTSCTL